MSREEVTVRPLRLIGQVSGQPYRQHVENGQCCINLTDSSLLHTRLICHFLPDLSLLLMIVMASSAAWETILGNIAERIQDKLYTRHADRAKEPWSEHRLKSPEPHYTFSA